MSIRFFSFSLLFIVSFSFLSASQNTLKSITDQTEQEERETLRKRLLQDIFTMACTTQLEELTEDQIMNSEIFDTQYFCKGYIPLIKDTIKCIKTRTTLAQLKEIEEGLPAITNRLKNASALYYVENTLQLVQTLKTAKIEYYLTLAYNINQNKKESEEEIKTTAF